MRTFRDEDRKCLAAHWGGDVFPGTTILRGVHFPFQLHPFGLILQDLPAVHESEIVLLHTSKISSSSHWLICIRHATRIGTDHLSHVSRELAYFSLDVIPTTHNGFLGPRRIAAAFGIVSIEHTNPKGFLPLAGVDSRIAANFQPRFAEHVVFISWEVGLLVPCCPHLESRTAHGRFRNFSNANTLCCIVEIDKEIIHPTLFQRKLQSTYIVKKEQDDQCKAEQSYCTIDISVSN